MGLIALLPAVHACGEDDGRCGSLRRLCEDDGRWFAVGTRVEGAVLVDLDGDGEDEAVALSRSGQQLELARGDGWRSLVFLPTEPVGIAALPGEVAVALTKPPAIAIFGMDDSGRLERRRDIVLAGEPKALRSGDLAGDGETVLIVGLAEMIRSGNPKAGAGQVAVIEPGSGATHTYAAGTYPYGLDLGDVDGDGQVDVVAVDPAEQTLHVLRGAGGGKLGPARTHAIGAQLVAVDLADHDGDGDLDALTRGTTTSVMIHRNSGAGEFSSPTALPLSASTPPNAGLVASPVANSGLAGVSVPLGPSLVTWFGKGAAWLGSVDEPLYTTATWVGEGPGGDLLAGGEGLLARFAYRRGAAPLEVWRDAELDAGGLGGGLVTGDLDGDHLLDVALVTDEKLHLLRGRADLGFDRIAALELAAPAWQLAIADVTGDGVADVVAAEETGVRVAVGGLEWGASVETTVTPRALVPLRAGDDQPVVLAVVGARLSDLAEPPGFVTVRFSADGSSAEESVLAGSLLVDRVVAVDFDEDGVDEPLILGRRDDAAVLVRMTPNGASYDPGPEHDLTALAGAAPSDEFFRALAVGDLDGDGAPEAVVGIGGKALRVDGLVDDAPALTALDAHTVTHLRDVDRDGHLDAVTLSAPRFAYWPGRGDGTFSDEYHRYEFLGAERLALASVSDAQFDLVQIGAFSMSAHLIREVVRPVPEDAVQLTPRGQELAVGDLDGDGSADVVVAGGADYLRGSLAWLRGGEGGLGERGDGSVHHTGLHAPALGDLDGDGALEIVAVDIHNRLYRYSTGSKREVEPLALELPDGFVARLALVDVDADARLDLVALVSLPIDGEFRLALTIAHGTGPGAFAPGVIVADAPASLFVELGLGDVDGDGDVDGLISPGDQPAVLVRGLGAREWGEPEVMPAGAAMFSRPDARGRVDLVIHDGATIYRHTRGRADQRAALASDETLAASMLLRVADADGDGDHDLVVADNERAYVWLRGDDGPRKVAIADVPLRVVEFADVDGDRRPDLVALYEGGVLLLRSGG